MLSVEDIGTYTDFGYIIEADGQPIEVCTDNPDENPNSDS